MTTYENRIKQKIPVKKEKIYKDDRLILKLLKDLAEELEIPVEEVAMNLHEQGIFMFEDIADLLNLTDYEE